MRAEAACAACEAEREYDPSRGIPFSAFARQKVLTSALTRYRQEWTYVMRCGEGYNGRCGSGDLGTVDSATDQELLLRPALSRLQQPQLWLIKQLFWQDRSEAQIAHDVGITQQAVSKRKIVVLRDLRRRLGESCHHPNRLALERL